MKFSLQTKLNTKYKLALQYTTIKSLMMDQKAIYLKSKKTYWEHCWVTAWNSLGYVVLARLNNNKM